MAGPPNAQLFFGPMLIGVFLNTILYGVLLVQLYNYFQIYRGSKKDPLWLRGLIFYLMILDTLSTVVLCYMIYDTLINVMLAGPPSQPPKPPKLLSVDAVVIVLVSTPVQLFLAYRIRKLTGSLLLALFIATLAIVSFGGGLSITILVSIFPNFEDFPKFIPASTTWLVSSALVDAIITGTLIITLYRKRTGIEVTDSVLNKIIIFTVQTGLLTAIFALADAILFLSLPGTGINFIPDFALSKLYTNTFLASLNARADRGALMGRPKGQVYVTGNSESRTRPISMSAGQTCFTTITSPLDITGNMSMLRPEDDNKTPRRFTLEDMDVESGRRPKQ